eukprot:5952432-Pyramimonas_sp.AAC.1
MPELGSSAQGALVHRLEAQSALIFGIAETCASVTGAGTGQRRRRTRARAAARPCAQELEIFRTCAAPTLASGLLKGSYLN